MKPTPLLPPTPNCAPRGMEAALEGQQGAAEKKPAHAPRSESPSERLAAGAPGRGGARLKSVFCGSWYCWVLGSFGQVRVVVGKLFTFLHVVVSWLKSKST